MIDQKVEELDEAVESIMRYSYQYNMKLVGIPQVNSRSETAEERVSICLKVFSEMGVSISSHDIDIAHTTPNKYQSNPAPIVCKFTRRFTKETVLSKRKEVHIIDLDNGYRKIITHCNLRASYAETASSVKASQSLSEAK